jgi:uncharacterized membrane-anchored protein
MTARNKLLIAAILLGFAQIGFLFWIIQSRATILRSGQEILLKVEPVDPRDLLRGDYVRLGYEISNVPASLISDAAAGDTSTEAGDIYVRLKRQDDGYWRAVSASLYRPSSVEPEPGEVDLRGTIGAGWNLAATIPINVDFGIERYYLPEGEGQAIERDMRVRPFGVLVAVADDGTPQIKALMDGNERLFEEPLY